MLNRFSKHLESTRYSINIDKYFAQKIQKHLRFCGKTVHGTIEDFKKIVNIFTEKCHSR